jgi:hypothetical protein
MLELLLNPDLLVVQAYLALLNGRELKRTALGDPRLVGLVRLDAAVALPLADVLIECGKEVVRLFLLHLVGAALRQVKPVVVLIAVVPSVLSPTLVAYEYLALLQGLSLQGLNNSASDHHPLANVIGGNGVEFGVEAACEGNAVELDGCFMVFDHVFEAILLQVLLQTVFKVEMEVLQVLGRVFPELVQFKRRVGEQGNDAS